MTTVTLTPEAIAEIVTSAVKAATAPLVARIARVELRESVKGEKGDPGKDADASVLSDLRAEIDEIKRNYDRLRSEWPDIDWVTNLVRATVAAAVATLPAPKDGDPGPPGPAGEKGLDGAPGRDGRDGQAGVPGPMGEKGLDGKDGRDGVNGKDGSDGLGFDDLRVDYDGERTFTVTFQRGDVIKMFPFTMPVVLYRGFYDASVTYTKGDAVTWGGSMWIARDETTSVAPDENSAQGKKAWALGVMRGRQGKQGNKGDPGERGPRGEAGVRGPQGY